MDGELFVEFEALAMGKRCVFRWRVHDLHDLELLFDAADNIDYDRLNQQIAESDDVSIKFLGEKEDVEVDKADV